MTQRVPSEIIRIIFAKVVHEIKLVISGGQDGVELGALQAAQVMNIGVFMPKDCLPESGTKKRRASEFKIQVSHESYTDRSIRNVDMADGVVTFLDKKTSGRGTTRTIRYAERGEHTFDPFTKPKDCDYLELSGPNVEKPCLIIWIPQFAHAGNPDECTAERKAKTRHFPKIITEFLIKHKIEKIMVSGFCENAFNDATDTTRSIMTTVFLYMAAQRKR
uniref:DNA processing protein A n=1 Tax=Clandestinovirus TaxID=2831644 RepID=A0A8F8KP00_9VIRU|nr:DNA processing protein A [Clandestinovirus]